MPYLTASSFFCGQHRFNRTKTRDSPQEKKQTKARNPPLTNKTSGDDHGHHEEITNDAFTNGEIWFEIHDCNVLLPQKWEALR